MKVKLLHIANIQTGFFAKPMATGEVVYLQAKHFDENGQLVGALHLDLKAEGISKKHLLRQGDILFAAKGTKNFATCYESKNPPAVASTSFFVIRLLADFQDKILPEYLVWWLNHQQAQSFLKGKAMGTAIVSISKAVLEELEINIPTVEIQQQVLRITQLRNREKELKQQIEALNDILIQQQIITAIQQ